jgi:hypothetical protein
MKILIVGFPRSGTTLSYRIFENHPDIEKMLFEKQSLKRVKTKEELLKKYPMYKKKNVGEKTIWEKRVMGKILIEEKFDIVDYVKRWNYFFGEEARVVQIIRHPFDSLNSLVLSKKRFPRGPKFDLVYKEYLDYASKFVTEIMNISNCFTIKYENLIKNPDYIIKLMYDHCGIDSSYKHKEKMKKGRIFNYKEKDFLFNYDSRLENIIDTFNCIDGPKYEKL